MTMQKFFRALGFCLFLTLVASSALGQEVYSIWEKGPPTSNGLSGPEPDSALIALYSNDLQVNEETPPTILIHSGDDQTVHPFNSIKFYSALRNANVPAELHIFEAGGHGYGLDPASASSGWTALVESWLSHRVK